MYLIYPRATLTLPRFFGGGLILLRAIDYVIEDASSIDNFKKLIDDYWTDLLYNHI